MFHKRLIKEFKSNQKFVVGMVMAQWIALVANILLISYSATFIRKIYSGGFDMRYVIGYLSVFVFVLCVRGGMNFLNSRLCHTVSSHVKKKMRVLIYEKIMRLGNDYKQGITTAEVMQLSTEGVEQLEVYVGKYMPQFFYSLLAPLTLFAVVGNISIKVAVVLIICVPLIPVSIIAVQKIAKKLLHKYWGVYTGLGDSFLESLQGLTTMKIYQADERYAKKMDEEAEQFRKITMRVLIMQLNSISVMDLVAFGGAALGIAFAVLELEKGNIDIGQCFFIIIISAEFFLPLRLLGSFFHIAMNGNAAAGKIFKLLDMSEKEVGVVDEIVSNHIEFHNVSFAYDEEKEILNRVTFEIKEQGMTAIVGESGCGKSTITSLIMGELTKFDGSVKIGNIEQIAIEEVALLKKITRIRHDSYIFQGTVKDNLLMGNENVREQDMLQALMQVDLYHTVIEKGGLSMKIHERASNLSGGQKQRLALARALLHDSDIYIFDEATSNIDVESENKIMQVVQELSKRKMVILISHRLFNVMPAEKIMVLKSGHMVEQGTHQELMKREAYYHRLFTKQSELEQYSKEAC